MKQGLAGSRTKRQWLYRLILWPAPKARSTGLRFTPALAEALAGLKKRKAPRTWKFNPHIDGLEGGKR